MSDEQKQTCECPAGKALRKMMAVLPAINKDFWAIYDGEAKAALSAPCSCAELRKKIDNDAVTLEYRSAVIEAQDARAKRDEAKLDSLRAELQIARDEIAQHDLWREEAYRQMAALRARVEALEADKARLDWLDRGPVWKMEKRYDTSRGAHWPVFFKPCVGWDEHMGDTARESIDRAMRK